MALRAIKNRFFVNRCLFGTLLMRSGCVGVVDGVATFTLTINMYSYVFVFEYILSKLPYSFRVPSGIQCFCVKLCNVAKGFLFNIYIFFSNLRSLYVKESHLKGHSFTYYRIFIKSKLTTEYLTIELLHFCMFLRPG